jgi:hypothetical protein
MTFNLITGVSSDDFTRLTDVLRRTGQGITEASPFFKGICTALFPGLVLLRGAIDIDADVTDTVDNTELIADLDVSRPTTPALPAAGGYSDIPSTVPDVLGD